MDKYIRNRNQLLMTVALKTLRGQGLTVEIVKDPGRGHTRADAFVRIGYGREKALYAAEVKRGLRPAMLGAVIHQLERFEQPPLLIADYVTPPMADALRARRIPFVDAAGNAYLEQAPLLIWIQGQRPKGDTLARGRGGRAFQASGLRVLFALICNPEWVNAPYRDLAQKAGVAHGTVGWVMAELPGHGFLTKLHGKRQLAQQERLLQQWAEHYPRVLRPRLALGRFHADNLEWWKTLNPTDYGAVFGGEMAAGRTTKYLRPGAATFYADRIDPRLVANLKLRADPQGGDVEILRRFWTFAEETPGLAPEPLIYADLMATGDARCIETAKLIYDRIFKDRR